METHSIERLLTDLVCSAMGQDVVLESKIELESLEFLELIKDCEDISHKRIQDADIIRINTVYDLLKAFDAIPAA